MTKEEDESGGRIWRIFFVFVAIWIGVTLALVWLVQSSKRSADSECRRVFGDQAESVADGRTSCWVDHVVKDLPGRN